MLIQACVLCPGNHFCVEQCRVSWQTFDICPYCIPTHRATNGPLQLLSFMARSHASVPPGSVILYIYIYMYMHAFPISLLATDYVR